MKFAILSALAAIGGAALGLVVVFLGFTRGEVAFDDGVGGGGALRRELAAEREAARELRDRVDRLERALASVADAPTRAAVARLPQVDQLPSAEMSGPARSSEPAAFDPRRLLAEYVASFEGGGEGYDFFRMAVAAYAWQLRRELQAIVVDRDAPDALRLQVMAMLDGGSFRGDAATIDALLEVARQKGWDEGAAAALAGLGRIGDRRTAQLVEELAPRLHPLKLRRFAWEALTALLGADADATFLRLLERESEVDGRIALLAYIRGGDRAAALRAYELASRDELPMRLEASGRIGRFRDEDFVALTREWLSREVDESVRARLRAALDEQKQIPAWHETQACGAPNVERVDADDGRAWASAQPDAGREWLELSYAPLRADRVTIHETCTTGAVVAVEVLEARAGWRTVWSGEDPTTAGGPFEVRFATTAAEVTKVRVILDTRKKSGWSEIDAVELSGPDGRGWAIGATASSRYGEGSGGATFSTDVGIPLLRGRSTK
jgi:hypothetical protein